MTLQEPPRQTLTEALTAIIAVGNLTETEAKEGRDLLARLQKPLRVTLFGAPQSGKSALLNLLVGQDILPPSHGLPTLLVRFGQTASATCTLADGRIETVPSGALQAIAACDPIFVDLALPLPALRKVSVLKVVASDDMTEQQRALRWAVRRTDCVLWSTRAMSPAGQHLWHFLPEDIRDHSHLVLTGLTTQSHADMPHKARTTPQGPFRSVIAVDSAAALAARGADGAIDRPAFRASGASALISAVLGEVDTAQRAASFAAEIFMTEKGAGLSAVPDAPAPVIATEAAPAAPARPPAIAGLSPAVRDLCTGLLGQITAQARTLQQDVEAGGAASDKVIDLAFDVVTTLADDLDSCDAADDPVLARLSSTAMDAADLMQLIKLEQGEETALDALSLMIQLKQDIQAELAA